jgi:hypothetical protein
MKPNPTAAPADPVLLALVGGWLAAEALAALLIAAAALLLTLAGWRPASRSKAEFRHPIHGAPMGLLKPPGKLTPPDPCLSALQRLLERCEAAVMLRGRPWRASPPTGGDDRQPVSLV